MSEAKSSHSKFDKQADRKRYPIIDYVAKPLIFMMLSLIVVIPAGFFMLDAAVDKVHSVQQSMTITLSDISPSDSVDKSVAPGDLPLAAYVGTLSSADIGIKCRVYNGVNRVSLRKGAAVSDKDGMPGSGRSICVYGYATTDFAKLGKAERGDKLTFSAYWGDFDYRVVDVVTAQSMPDPDGEYLILCTDTDSRPFACTSGKALYVLAIPDDGTGQEVQYE